MRVLILTFVLFILLVGFGFYTVVYLSETSSEMVNLLDKIDRAVDKGNWTAAEEYLKALEESWNKNKAYWSILINHDEIDNIELSINHIREYIGVKNTPESRAEIAGLRLFLEHIPENERLSLENIL